MNDCGIGTKTLSEIRQELRQAFASSGGNPIADLDRKIRKLKKAKSPEPGVIEALETFRRALEQVVA